MLKVYNQNITSENKEVNKKMLNNLILVGRIVEDAKIVTLETGQKVTNIRLAVQRPFKNLEDEYDTDFINVSFWLSSADIAYEYGTKGSIIGVKGRIASKIIEVQGVKINTLDVIGERIAFIQIKEREKPIEQ